MTIYGNIVDIEARRIFAGSITFEINEKISVQESGPENKAHPYILPGFIDAHVHIESSMLTPAHFARLAVVHGTVGTVSDPHEIGNVLGVDGVHYMIEDSKKVDFHFAFGAPSCVPATVFEHAGADITSNDIEILLRNENIYYLAEMMNFPGVLHNDEEVCKKIELAIAAGKPVDGHAPGLRGAQAKTYFSKGITTDHECFTLEEAEEKLGLGVKILIREGSAAKNFEALIPLAKNHFPYMMFCSDDKHPDDLVKGHINQLVVRAIHDHQLNLFSALQMACINPVKHYDLKSGLLKNGDNADFIVVKDLNEFEIISTYINGKEVAHKGITLIPVPESEVVNNFNAKPIDLASLCVNASKTNHHQIRVIKVFDGQLVTQEILSTPFRDNQCLVSNVKADILKLVVYNRYNHSKASIAFIHGFGLQKGAIASTIAHDSHNIIATGVDDNDIVNAINQVISCKGGISASYNDENMLLPLPIAGLMSNKNGYEVASAYEAIDHYVKTKLGSSLASPYMSLSFMALLVIPRLKLSDMGLFDGEKFEFVELMYP